MIPFQTKKPITHVRYVVFLFVCVLHSSVSEPLKESDHHVWLELGVAIRTWFADRLVCPRKKRGTGQDSELAGPHWLT